MIGVIDVGGGLRGIYGAGVFDRCLDDEIEFDCCIGVSAGSANIASFLAKQKGRNYTFHHDYTFRKEYMSLQNIIRCGSYIDLDYVYGTLTHTGGENPLDYDEIEKYNGEIVVVATDANTGKAHYFTKNDIDRDSYLAFNASSSLPLINRPTVVNGIAYYDGGISDPVPIEHAFEIGCDKVVVILTRPVDFRMDGKFEKMISPLMKPKYPKIASALIGRIDAYNSSIDKLIEYKKDGRCLIVAPDDCCGIDTLTKDQDKLDQLYHKGYEDGKAIAEFMTSACQNCRQEHQN